MKWKRARRSDNVEDRRGIGGVRAAGGIGLGETAVIRPIATHLPSPSSKAQTDVWPLRLKLTKEIRN